MIEEFISKFTKEKIKYVKRGNNFFLVPDLVLKNEQKVSQKSVSIGLSLGEIKEGKFKPSFPLFNWISKHTLKKVFLTDKAAFNFLCKKNISNESIVKKGIDSGLVLVQTKNDENLGIGIIEKDKIKNIFDRGDYLRRERKSSIAS